MNKQDLSNIYNVHYLRNDDIRWGNNRADAASKLLNVLNLPEPSSTYRYDYAAAGYCHSFSLDQRRKFAEDADYARVHNKTLRLFSLMAVVLLTIMLTAMIKDFSSLWVAVIDAFKIFSVLFIPATTGTLFLIPLIAMVFNSGSDIPFFSARNFAHGLSVIKLVASAAVLWLNGE